MADEPENPPKQPWTGEEYKRRTAARRAADDQSSASQSGPEKNPTDEADNPLKWSPEFERKMAERHPGASAVFKHLTDQKKKPKGVNLFDLAKRISDQANSEESRKTVEGLQKLADSLRASEESFRQKLADMAKGPVWPSDYRPPEIDTDWQRQLAERQEARRKEEAEAQHQAIANAVRDAFREAEDRARVQREAEDLGRGHGFPPIEERPIEERPKTPIPPSNKEHWFDQGVWANPLVLGILVMLAFAISFSPKASTLATWFCLLVAWLLATRLIHTRTQKWSRRWLLTILLSAVSGILFAGFGWWLVLPIKASLVQSAQSEMPIQRESPTPPMVSAKRSIVSPPLTSTPAPTPSLKQRALALSREIQIFLDNRKRTEPETVMGQGPEVFNRSAQRQTAYAQETVRLYQERFHAEVNSILTEIKYQGVDTNFVEFYAERPTNPLGVQEVSSQLAALAGRLRD